MPSGQTQSPTGSRNKKKTSKHKKLEPNKKETRASSKVLWRTANGRIREKLKKDPAKKKKGKGLQCEDEAQAAAQAVESELRSLR